MSDKDTSGGIHYHYHFYGPGAQPPEAGAEARAPQPPFPGYPPQGLPPGPNPHAHPGADSLVKGLAVGAGAGAYGATLVALGLRPRHLRH